MRELESSLFLFFWTVYFGPLRKREGGLEVLSFWREEMVKLCVK